jgi:hypothetical protein
MKILYIIAISVLFAIFLVLGCDSSNDISGAGNDSTTVLLYHSFTQRVVSSDWDIVHPADRPPVIDEDGVLYVCGGSFPGGIPDSGYLISRNSYQVDEDDEYLISLRCSVCLCGIYSSNNIGLKCNDASYDSDDFGVGFWGVDYGSGEEILDEIADSILVIADEYEFTPHCEGFHVFQFKISRIHASIIIDGEIYYEISDNLEEAFAIDSFLIFASASPMYYSGGSHCIGIDWVRVEKYLDR